MTTFAFTLPPFSFQSRLWRNGFPCHDIRNDFEGASVTRRQTHSQRNTCVSQSTSPFIASARRRNDQLDHPARPQRKSRRKTAEDVRRERKLRVRNDPDRPTVIALWAGVVLAETKEYEFMDGRFHFPANSVRWQVIEPNGSYKHFNPVGRACIYDIVLRSETVKRPGAIVLRNRGAVTSFVETKHEWNAMKGYTSFAKGVKIMEKPVSFRESIRPGAVRSRAVLHSAPNGRDVEQKEFETAGDGMGDWGAFSDLSRCQ